MAVYKVYRFYCRAVLCNRIETYLLLSHYASTVHDGGCPLKSICILNMKLQLSRSKQLGNHLCRVFLVGEKRKKEHITL